MSGSMGDELQGCVMDGSKSISYPLLGFGISGTKP